MATSEKRFYFTAHPGDLMRSRLPEGCNVMLVAAAHWCDSRKRFRIRRPPTDHIDRICIDSGGFTAATRWGRYPWLPEQYADFVAETCSQIGLRRLDFVACMDYACEPAVDRSVISTNRQRIDATHENEEKCRGAAPCLPWLPVLQGDTIEERQYDLSRRRRLDLLPRAYAGVGSVCGRGARAAAKALLFYTSRLPTLKLHAFGLDVRTLDHPDAWHAVHSWDSYAWTWPPGVKGADRPQELHRRAGESYSSYIGRCARYYLARTVEPRMQPPSQLTLL